MEKGGGGDPSTRAAGGMCDRLLTFLANNLSMSRVKSIADGGPKYAAAAGDHPAAEGAEGKDLDEFAIPIERAEFDFEYFSGHGDGATVLGESATTTRDVHVPEQKVAAAADGPVAAAGPAAAPAAEETKVRRTVTIKDDRPAAEGAAPAPVERKKSLFKKRQASSAGAGGDGEEPRAPRRSGLRPRMPRVLSNINERSSTFIEERRMGFGGSGAKPARDK
ncbi:hypothetical protein BS78_05G225400 [Paspalum vaginatum]|nr:hypothetical protein BS78_05G225400 [Paspalum vaginatum]